MKACEGSARLAGQQEPSGWVVHLTAPTQGTFLVLWGQSLHVTDSHTLAFGGGERARLYCRGLPFLLKQGFAWCLPGTLT